MLEFQTWSVIATVLYSVAYCCVLLPCLPCYSSPHLSFHLRSFAHLGVARLRPLISTYITSSTAHPGISRLRLSIPTTRYTSLPSPGSYCADIPSRHFLILASREISSRFARSCLSVAPWRHHASLLRQSPS